MLQWARAFGAVRRGPMKEREGIRAKAVKSRCLMRTAPKHRAAQKVRRGGALFTKPIDFLMLRNEIKLRVERAA